MFAACAAMAQQPPPAQSPPQPPSLSPAMPVAPNNPADPAKLAEPAGAKGAAGAPVDAATFVLGAEDQITVKMWDEPKFDGAYTIRPDGKIALPLIGEIQAAGRTPLQLQDAIDKAALSQLKTPRSSVNVVGVHSKHVYFDGEGIAQPGSMDLVIPIHLLEGISARGGFKDFANKNKITILRDGKKLLIDRGGKKSEYFKYSDMTSGKHPESNPLLMDNDHVIVP
jgi:polysaccharide export outer membrane protein